MEPVIKPPLRPLPRAVGANDPGIPGVDVKSAVLPVFDPNEQHRQRQFLVAVQIVRVIFGKEPRFRQSGGLAGVRDELKEARAIELRLWTSLYRYNARMLRI